MEEQPFNPNANAMMMQRAEIFAGTPGLKAQPVRGNGALIPANGVSRRGESATRRYLIRTALR
jgi:hypothetical protein